MLFEQIIANNTSLQPYEYISTEIAEDGKQLVLHLGSRRNTAEEACPYCGGHVHICGSCSMRLRDMPVYPGTKQDIEIAYHRYRCQSCERTFCEEIPFKHSETRITERAATPLQYTDLHRTEDHRGALGYDKAHTQGSDG